LKNIPLGIHSALQAARVERPTVAFVDFELLCGLRGSALNVVVRGFVFSWQITLGRRL
jgi:hypothetical protein